MIVMWQKPNAGIKTIDIPNEKGKAEKTIYLVPGANEVETSEWEKAKINPQIQDQIKKGYFKEFGIEKEVEKSVLNEETGKKEKQKVKEVVPAKISELDASEAVALVKETADLKTLKAWQKIEGRDEVRACIANQIEDIESGKVLK